MSIVADDYSLPRHSLKDITQPQSPATSEPVTLEEAKAHLRVTTNDEDAYIAALVVAARQAIENHLERDLVPKLFSLCFDTFPVSAFQIPRAPVRSIGSITYQDGTSPAPVVDPSVYDLDTGMEVAEVFLRHGETWPSARYQRNSVEIIFSSGYASPDDVPQALKNGMLLLLGDLYENREEHVVGLMITPSKTIQTLIKPYRVLTP